MDGISLDGIMGMLQPVLPTLSYFVNFITKLFDVFTSYLGFDIQVPTPEEPGEEDITEAPVA